MPEIKILYIGNDKRIFKGLEYYSKERGTGFQKLGVEWSGEELDCKIYHSNDIPSAIKFIGTGNSTGRSINAVIYDPDGIEGDEKPGALLRFISREFLFLTTILWASNSPPEDYNHFQFDKVLLKKDNDFNSVLHQALMYIIIYRPLYNIHGISSIEYIALVNSPLLKTDELFRKFENIVPLIARKEAVSYIRQKAGDSATYILFMKNHYENGTVKRNFVDSNYTLPKQALARRKTEHDIYLANNFDTMGEGKTITLNGGKFTVKYLEGVFRKDLFQRDYQLLY